eukprot:2404071-Alexandrium_andersonii.AAC.1
MRLGGPNAGTSACSSGLTKVSWCGPGRARSAAVPGPTLKTSVAGYGDTQLRTRRRSSGCDNPC